MPSDPTIATTVPSVNDLSVETVIPRKKLGGVTDYTMRKLGITQNEIRRQMDYRH